MISITNIVPPLPIFFSPEDTGSDVVREFGLEHSPARIVGQAIIDAGLGIDGEDVNIGQYNRDIWYVFDNREPDRPDKTITVYDTQGRDSGYLMDGKRIEYPGIQVRLRSQNYRTGYRELNRIANFLDRITRTLVVLVDDQEVQTGTGVVELIYSIDSIERTSNVIPLGTDTPQGKRLIFVLNAVCSIRSCC